MKNLVIAFLLGTSLCFIQVAAAQQPAAASSGAKASDQEIDKDVELLRADLRSNKKQVIAANMKLTDAQAEKFWPVYDAYTQETTKLGDARYALIKEYAKTYDTMTDAQADDLLKRTAALDQQAATLRQQWIPKFRKVLTGKQTALFFQLDRRITLLIDLQLASEIPLVK
jgi:Spy/CpxP family protein refolding chaperone